MKTRSRCDQASLTLSEEKKETCLLKAAAIANAFN